MSLRKTLGCLFVVSIATGVASADTLVSAGQGTTCKIDGGALYCWGDNSHGQLGIGNVTEPSVVPLAVTGMASDVTYVSVAPDGPNVCAIQAGRLYCWGDNTYGQIGDGTIGVANERHVPTLVAGMLAGQLVTKVAAGSDHTCAIGHNSATGFDDAGFCWGDNSHGQLGDSSTTAKIVPTNNVPHFSTGGPTFGVLDIDAGSFFTCSFGYGLQFSFTQPEVYCWGKSDVGQSGQGVTSDILAPNKAIGGSMNSIPNSISVGVDHACATLLEKIGIVFVQNTRCWGNNASGQLGDGTTTNRLLPVIVGGAHAMTSVAAGTYHTCGADVLGNEWCWGKGDKGQFDRYPITTPTTSPRAIPSSEVPNVSLSLGEDTTCFILGGVTHCVGDNSDGQIGDGTREDNWGTYALPTVDTDRVSVGARNVCQILGGTLSCLGDNSAGQLGDDTTDRHATATVASGLDIGVTDVSVAADGTTICAIQFGSVYCWGDNTYGQVGSGSLGGKHFTPELVAGVTGAVVVSTSADHTCALATRHSHGSDSYAVYCWGSNSNGQLGDNTIEDHYTATLVPGLDLRMTAVSVGHGYSCAIQSLDATPVLSCWGSNDQGKLGNGLGEDQHVPTAVALASPTTISAGYDHACAIASGVAMCWGNNDDGELGDGSTVDRPRPVMVNGALALTRLSAGTNHTCGSNAASSYCWGKGDRGQLDTYPTSIPTTSPLALPLAHVPDSQISAGNGATCFVFAGALICAGNNADGQLGDGSTEDLWGPYAIPNVAGTTLSAGAHNTCAIDTNGALTCWGDNSAGQIGDGTTAPRLTATAVSGMSAGVTDVAVSVDGDTVCAVQAGFVYCWGDNSAGQLGNGSTGGTHYLPSIVIGVTGAVKVAVASDHACALGMRYSHGSNSYGIYCWGKNDKGQLGDGTTTDHLVATTASTLDNRGLGITVASSFSCALQAQAAGSSFAYCWGLNDQGQLGIGSTDDSHVPALLSLTSPTAMSAGPDHACAIAGGAAYCWGDNTFGELGDTTTAQRTSPTALASLASGVLEIAAGGAHSCATTSTNGYCWGSGLRGQLDTYPNTGFVVPHPLDASHVPASSITAGDVHTCFRHGGSIVCIGGNDDGQAGDGTNYDAFPQPAVPTVATRRFSTGGTNGMGGSYTSCFISSGALHGGGLYCWGGNASGQIGDGSRTTRPAPTPVTGMASGVTDVSISMSGNTVCAIKSSSLYCWGDNTLGQFGDGSTASSNTPVLIPAMNRIAAHVSASGPHTCALALSTTVFGAVANYCWGDNTYGGLGLGSYGGLHRTPAIVVGQADGMIELATNTDHTCATRQVSGTSSIYCWGRNTYGQLGNNSTSGTNTPGPAVLSGTGAALPNHITTGWGHTCALVGTGARCWGINSNGQLGDNTVAQRLTPTPVIGGFVWTDISAGGDHTCATTGSTGSGRGLYCWGWHGHGQLGTGGNVFFHSDTHLPTVVQSSTIALDLAAGGYHTCATWRGLVTIPMCWGDNTTNELGDGTTSTRYAPVTVLTPSGGW